VLFLDESTVQRQREDQKEIVCSELIPKFAVTVQADGELRPPQKIAKFLEISHFIYALL
jgi:hypothetical protein